MLANSSLRTQENGRGIALTCRTKHVHMCVYTCNYLLPFHRLSSSHVGLSVRRSNDRSACGHGIRHTFCWRVYLRVCLASRRLHGVCAWREMIALWSCSASCGLQRNELACLLIFSLRNRVGSVYFRFLYACCLVWAMRATWTTIDYYVSRMFVLASDVFLWCLSNSQYKLVAVSVIRFHRQRSFALQPFLFDQGYL